MLHRITRNLNAIKTAEINYRLLSIRPPQEVSRLIRPLADFTRGNWRVSELRIVAYLAPLLFRGLLPSSQYENIVLFSTAVYHLHRSTISASDLPKCQRQLQRSCRQLQTVYNDKSIYTYNVHLLLHLSDRVKLAGPLYTHSCDEFEMLFAKMLSAQHGTRGAAEQVLRYFNVRSALHNTALHLSVSSKRLAEFCNRRMCQHFSTFVTCVNPSTTLLGIPTLT